MAGLDPAIHVFRPLQESKTWMPGTRPGTTRVESEPKTVSTLTTETSREAVRETAARETSSWWPRLKPVLLAIAFPLACSRCGISRPSTGRRA